MEVRPLWLLTVMDLCRWTVRPLWLLTVMDCCVDGGEAIVVTNRYGLLCRWR